MSDILFTGNDLIAIRGKAIVLHASAARTEDGDTKTSDPIRVSQFREANFFLDVTALPGTPSPTVIFKIYTKCPISGHWYVLDTFTTVTGVTTEMRNKTGNLGTHLAVGWDIGGDASGVTFSMGAVVKA